MLILFSSPWNQFLPSPQFKKVSNIPTKQKYVVGHSEELFLEWQPCHYSAEGIDLSYPKIPKLGSIV
jgi:hypothetical protein